MRPSCCATGRTRRSPTRASGSSSSRRRGRAHRRTGRRALRDLLRSPPPCVLNAFIQALNGLFDMGSPKLGERQGARLFAAGDREARRELPKFDTGHWARYSLSGEISDPSYTMLLRDFLARPLRRARPARRTAAYARSSPRYLNGCRRRRGVLPATAARQQDRAAALPAREDLARVAARRRGGRSRSRGLGRLATARAASDAPKRRRLAVTVDRDRPGRQRRHATGSVARWPGARGST